MTLEAWFKQLRAAPLLRNERQKVPTRRIVSLPVPELDAILDLVEAAVRRGRKLTVSQEMEAEHELFRGVEILKSLVAKRGN
jgi:hypothetical protein